jgi:LmbE family N-acetylglucosaminyl deacetylase
MPILVVSPHFDDAVFSIGEAMLGWIDDGYEVVVLTVFGAVLNEKETILEREHREAMTKLGVSAFVNLDFADDAHGPNIDVRKVRNTVNKVVHDTRCGVSVWPFGIHHPDHVLVSILGGARRPKWVYDELPYFVVYPEQASDPADWGWTRMWSPNFLARKRELVNCYASAVTEELERSLYAPERLWKVK